MIPFENIVMEERISLGITFFILSNKKKEKRGDRSKWSSYNYRKWPGQVQARSQVIMTIDRPLFTALWIS